jgi:homocysteine S-methyltransferase
MDFSKIINQYEYILTEGSIIERIKRESQFQLDPHIANAGFLYEPKRATVLTALYRQYIDIAKEADLPVLIFTPTWRANPERLLRSGLENIDVNGDAVRYLQKIRESYGKFARKIFIGGLMGCAGDAYRPEESLGIDEAAQFHHAQLHALANAGVDFLFASTLPARPEAIGIARAMASTGAPYILSVIIRPEGTLLDGTPLKNVIREIDDQVHPKPLGYMINCVHPVVMMKALENTANIPADLYHRILGLQANTSSKRPEELDESPTLDTTEPQIFAEEMNVVRRNYGFKIFGGCCGTNQQHIKAVAQRLVR